MSQNALVYREQGGKRLVVAAGAELAISGALTGLLPGTDYFVDSTNGSNSNTGLSWSAAVATWDYAVGLCTASHGDRIFIAPWHAENLTAATTVNCDVAGVEVIGLTRGNQRPTFSSTAAAGSVTIGAANVTIRNLRLTANFAGGSTTAVTIAAAGDGCTLDNVEFRDAVAGSEWLIHVSVATTVDNLRVTGCSFVGLTGESMTNSILFAGTSTNCVIEDCLFFVDSSDDVIDHLTAASVNLVVRRCQVVNADTDAAGYCLRYKSDGTGVAHDNRFAYNKVDAEISVGAAAWWFENYASNTIAQSGLLDPSTSHAIP